MFKVVTLMKRKPGLAVQDFQALLGSSHGPLAAGGLGLGRCVLSRALPQGYAKGELLFDAVSEMWFDNEQAYRSFLRTPQAAAARDAVAAFLDESRTVVMPVDVFVIKSGPIPNGAVKNIEFVNRRPGMALGPFRDYWRDVHGPLASRIPMIHRYEQNHLAPSAYQDDRDPVYDGLAVTWFSSTADMKRGTATREYAATRADEPNFLPDGHLPIIITREDVIAE